MNLDFIDSLILFFIVSKIMIFLFSYCEFSYYIGFFFYFYDWLFLFLKLILR